MDVSSASANPAQYSPTHTILNEEGALVFLAVLPLSSSPFFFFQFFAFMMRFSALAWQALHVDSRSII